MATPVAQRFTGTPIKRSEDPRILTGRGRYISDITLPAIVHGAFLHSPYAHARILSIDTAAARELPGVLAVYTGAEMEALISPGNYGLPGAFNLPSPEHSLLATDKVRLVGDLVAFVVAESRYIAEDGCGLIDVEYDELPAVASVAQALAPEAPIIFEAHGSNLVMPSAPNEFGDVEGVFAKADRVVKATFHQHRHQNVPMETRGVIATYDPQQEKMTVHTSTQGVHYVAMIVAARLGMEMDKVRILTADVGGSFGLKIAGSREDVAVCAAARDIGRPVKWIEDRSEHMQASGHAREESLEIEAAITNEGDILGLKVNMLVDTGAYPGVGLAIGGLVESIFPSAYKIEALSFQFTGIITNKASYVAYRGPWAAETFVRERMIDIVAKEVGKEPIDIRLRNVVDGVEDRRMITGRTLVGCTAMQSIERIADLIDVPEFRARQAIARADGRYLGLGVATFIEGAPGPRGDAALGAEAMRIQLADDGTLLLYTGQMPHGQSHETTLAQIAADQFGVPFERVKVIVGDTDLVPPGATGGSLSATMAGGASLTTARMLKSKVLDVATHVFEAGIEDIEIVDGNIGVVGVPTSAMTLAAFVAAARSTGALPTGVEADFTVENVYDGGQGGWSGGTHAAIVEIDIGTGLVQIERYVVSEDCGELINPAVVDGQIRGGVAQGIGAVLLEKSAYDDAGNFLATTFVDYLLPSTTVVPRIEIHHLATIPQDPDVNFRGVGEGGMIVCPPTLVNAIEDALAPFGVTIYEQHMPPSRILELAGVIPVG
jgi:carbon-monoxide dehydrogenase large subunit